MEDFNISKYFRDKLLEQEDTLEPQEVPGEEEGDDEEFDDYKDYNPERAYQMAKDNTAALLKKNLPNVDKDVLNIPFLTKAIRTAINSKKVIASFQEWQSEEDLVNDNHFGYYIWEPYFMKYLLPQGITEKDQIRDIVMEIIKLFEMDYSSETRKNNLERKIKDYEFQVDAFRQGKYPHLIWSDEKNTLVKKNPK